MSFSSSILPFFPFHQFVPKLSSASNVKKLQNEDVFSISFTFIPSFISRNESIFALAQDIYLFTIWAATQFQLNIIDKT